MDIHHFLPPEPQRQLDAFFVNDRSGCPRSQKGIYIMPILKRNNQKSTVATQIIKILTSEGIESYEDFEKKHPKLHLDARAIPGLIKSLDRLCKRNLQKKTEAGRTPPPREDILAAAELSASIEVFKKNHPREFRAAVKSGLIGKLVLSQGWEGRLRRNSLPDATLVAAVIDNYRGREHRFASIHVDTKSLYRLLKSRRLLNACLSELGLTKKGEEDQDVEQLLSHVSSLFKDEPETFVNISKTHPDIHKKILASRGAYTKCQNILGIKKGKAYDHDFLERFARKVSGPGEMKRRFSKFYWAADRTKDDKGEKLIDKFRRDIWKSAKSKITIVGLTAAAILESSAGFADVEDYKISKGPFFRAGIKNLDVYDAWTKTMKGVERYPRPHSPTPTATTASQDQTSEVASQAEMVRMALKTIQDSSPEDLLKLGRMLGLIKQSPSNNEVLS